MRCAALLAILTLAAVPVSGSMRFVEVARDSGIDFTTTSGAEPSREILEVNGGGVALIDYDRDGDLDLFVANGATLAKPDAGPGSRMWRNDGRGRFTDVTQELGLSLKRWAMGVTVGDYDADGDDDLYVTCYGPNVLLRNSLRDGRRRFEDVAPRAGVDDSSWSTSAAFGDVDGDGDLDLYVANYLEFDAAKPPSREGRMFKGVQVFAGPAGLSAQHDRLYENLGDGRFKDVAAARGALPERAGYGLGVVILDLDGNGHQDIFVGNDSTENFLFLNKGDGTFDDRGYSSGIALNADGRPQATMGIAISDVDGNGRPDVFSTNFSSDTNTLHLNVDARVFTDATSRFGLAAVSRPFLSWGAGFYDFDTDGDEDLWIASGHIYPEAEAHEMDTGYRQPVLLFERRGGRFVRAEKAGAALDALYSGRSTAFGDLDDDGDVDVVLTQLNDAVKLFRNDSPGGAVVVVELIGAAGNPHAFGSVVELAHGTRIQRRWIHGGGYQAANSPLAYFGIPRSEIVDTRPTLRVRWPDGSRSEWAGVTIDRRLIVEQGSKAIRTRALGGRTAP